MAQPHVVLCVFYISIYIVASFILFQPLYSNNYSTSSGRVLYSLWVHQVGSNAGFLNVLCLSIKSYD